MSGVRLVGRLSPESWNSGDRKSEPRPSPSELIFLRSVKNDKICDPRWQLAQKPMAVPDHLNSCRLKSNGWINDRTYISIPLDLNPHPPRDTTCRFDEICRFCIHGRAFNLLESLFWMGPLDGGLSAYIGNYPLAFVGYCPPGPTKRRSHFRNYLRGKFGRRLSLSSFLLYTAVYILCGYLRNSADGSRATTEAADKVYRWKKGETLNSASTNISENRG